MNRLWVMTLNSVPFQVYDDIVLAGAQKEVYEATSIKGFPRKYELYMIQPRFNKLSTATFYYLSGSASIIPLSDNDNGIGGE